MTARPGYAISAVLVASTALCALPRTAFADDDISAPQASLAATPAAPTAPDTVKDEGNAERRKIDRTWLYVDDARTPDQWQVIGTSSLAYTAVGSKAGGVGTPYRPFASNTAQPGALVSVGAEVGLLSWLSLEAMGQMDVAGASAGPSPGAIVDLRVRLTPESWKNIHIVASGGYARETWQPGGKSDDGDLLPGQPHGDNAAWGQVAVVGDINRLHLALTAHGEHGFANGRDGVDVMIKAGANYKILDWLRAGVEYVGQDLEESFKDGAEGGARHFIGPTAGVQLLSDRLSIVAGPSLGLSAISPEWLGRVGVSYGF